MHADHLDAQRARLLDEAQADLVRQEIAFAVRPPLRVRLPGADAPALLELGHGLDVARLVGIDAPVQQQTMGAFHAIDDAPGRIRDLDRERLGIALRWDERQHHHVGVAVEKNVLDELVGSETTQVAALARLVCKRALGFRRPLERLGRRCLRSQVPFGSTKWPWTSKMNSSLSHLRCGEIGVERRVRSTSKHPPRLPAAALAALNASNVLATPQDDSRKSRRLKPSRFAFRLPPHAPNGCRRDSGDSATGANSPFDVVSSLMGSRRPWGSIMCFMA